MTEHTVLIDFDPWSEVSYHAHLAHQHARAIEKGLEDQSREITRPISAQTRDLIGSAERRERQIEKGLATQSQIQRTLAPLAHLPESLDRLDRTVQRGLGAIAWSYGRLSNEIDSLRSELIARLDALIEVAKMPSQTWAYEQFGIARRYFNKGLYEDACTAVGLAISGSPPVHVGYKGEFLFHYLLGNIRLGSSVGDKPNIDPRVVDAALAEEAFLTAARYADNSGDKSEAFLCAGRSAFLQRDLRRAITHTNQAFDGSRHPSDVHYQLAKYHAGLPDSVGRGEASQHLRIALRLNLDLLWDAWEEEAYFNRVGALEDALLDAAPEFRTKVRTAIDDYRLAGCFASFPRGRAEAIDHLRAAIDENRTVLRVALADEARLNRNGILDEVVQRTAVELREKVQCELDNFERVLRFVGTVEDGGFSASGLLESELIVLEHAVATARNESAKGRIEDLDAAIAALAAQRAVPDGLKSDYLTRLERALREEWHNSPEYMEFEKARENVKRIPRSFRWPELSFEGWPGADWWWVYILFWPFAFWALVINFTIWVVRTINASQAERSWRASLQRVDGSLIARQTAADSLWQKSQAVIDKAVGTEWSW